MEKAVDKARITKTESYKGLFIWRLHCAPRHPPNPSKSLQKETEIEKQDLNFIKLDVLSNLYLKPLLDKNIEELILGCSHYPLIYNFLRKKIDPNINIIDPSKALIKKFNKSFAFPKTDRYECLSCENVKFFATAKKDEFSKKVKFWLEINKEIRLVNLRSNV